MEEDTDTEARSAAQGLLDIAIKASRRGVEPPGPKNKSTTPKEADEGGATGNPVSRTAAFRPLVPRPSSYTGSGRIITSGNTPPVTKSKDDSSSGFKPPEGRASEAFQQPRPRKPDPQERVTLIVSKPQEEREATEDKTPIEDDRKPSFDLPVPPSAFAIPGRPSAESINRQRTWESVQHENDTESDDEDHKRPAGARPQPPAKRAKMDRQVSINTALHHIGSKDKLVDESSARPVQIGSEISQWPQSSQRKSEQSAFSPVDVEAAQKLWGSNSASVRDPSLMPRNSSDRSTLDVHKQIAAQCSNETITNQPLGLSLNTHPEAAAEMATPLRGAMHSMDFEQLIDQRSKHGTHSLIGTSVSVEDEGKRGALVMSSSSPRGSLPDTQEAGGNAGMTEDTETTLWSGQIKHRLKTATGSSVAELFSLNAQVPSKLLEQFPSTIFVTVITGRANVKLGKHYVASCQLTKPTEKQLLKATTLANMKLVAICELQHCTVTLVPYKTAESGLRLAAFLVADE